jgi:hypothetical protein
MMLMTKGNLMSYHLALYEQIDASADSSSQKSNAKRSSQWNSDALQVSRCIFFQVHEKARLSSWR